MSGNYPDGLSEGSTGAPWAAVDDPPLICSHCEHEPDDGVFEVGTACLYNNAIIYVDPCEGAYVERKQVPS